jgi:O-antigen ligase
MGFISGYTKDSLWLTFVAFSLPAACIGKYYAKDRSNALFIMTKYLDILFVILSASVISLSSRLSASMATGDNDYSQRLSYYAALCFLLDTFLFVYGNTFDRFSLFKTRLVRLIYYCLLLVFVVVIFFSGGRGGFVVVAVGTIAIAFLYRKIKFKNVLLGTIAIIAITTLLSFFAKMVSSDVAAKFEENQKRVLSYINTDDSEEDTFIPVKIDMTQTSGRDDVYQEAWNMFLKKPITKQLHSFI